MKKRCTKRALFKNNLEFFRKEIPQPRSPSILIPRRNLFGFIGKSLGRRGEYLYPEYFVFM